MRSSCCAFFAASSNKRASGPLRSTARMVESIFIVSLLGAQELPQLDLFLLQFFRLGPLLVIGIEREASGDDPIARRSRAIAERPADALALDRNSRKCIRR